MAKTKSKAQSASRIWKLLEKHVFDVESRDDTFNFYRDVDPEVDIAGAAEIRRENLRGYLEQVTGSARTLVLGQSPGWRGARFTGVPFTSQAQLLRPDFPVQGSRTSQGPNPLSEKTATRIWSTFLPYHPRVFLWYAFPLHAHRPGASQTDRTPSRRELGEFTSVLEGILGIIEPEGVLAVGRGAQMALQDLEVDHTYVQHPDYARLRTFQRGVKEALENEEED